VQYIKILGVAISIAIGLMISFIGALHANSKYEADLLHVVALMMTPAHEITTDMLNQFVAAYPESRTGYIMIADLFAAKAGLSTSLGQKMEHADRDVVTDLRNQLSIRWSYHNVIKPARKNLTPSSLLQLSTDHDLILFMDIPASRLILYKRAGRMLHNIESFYASIGIKGFGKSLEGDKKTPVGIYRITGFIPGNSLHEKYGPGALPLDYPNLYDRLSQNTGDGIWIHGTEPGYVNRAPLASDGCISIANKDFKKLISYIDGSIPTPIVIDSSPEWVSNSNISYRRARLLQAIKKWSQVVGEGEQEKYLNFYDTSFFETRLNIPEKSRTILADFPLDAVLDLGKSNLFSYPGIDDLYVADLQFIDTRADTFVVRQYWIEKSGKNWKIVSQLRIPK
tara:strand:- start:1882 stop:3069 length:1188 start_codon:yes stop_codon:yes gene_type:complete